MLETPLQQIEQIMNQTITEKVMPGAVTFVARGRGIVKHNAYGFSVQYTDSSLSEMGIPIPMQTDTIFDLASISGTSNGKVDLELGRPRGSLKTTLRLPYRFFDEWPRLVYSRSEAQYKEQAFFHK